MRAAAGEYPCGASPTAPGLLARADLEPVYGGGPRRSSPQFTLFFRSQQVLAASRARQEFEASRANPRPGPRSRFGISVKKAVGGAVVRNRIRRRIREILRLSQSEIPSGWDIVIHPRSTVARAEFASLQAELLRLLRSVVK